MHSGAQDSGMAFGHAGDQIGGPRQRQSGRKSPDDGDEFSLQPEWFQGFVNRSGFESSARDADVLPGGVTGGRDPALAERMTCSHRANVTIAEQGLHAQFWSGRLFHHTGFQMDNPVAEGRAVFVGLRHKTQSHAGRGRVDARDEFRPEVFHKAFAGPQREGAVELFEIEFLHGTKHRAAIFHELPDPLAEFERAGSGHEIASSPDQQRIAGGLTQSRQRPTHGRRTEPQTSGRACDAAFRQQDIQGDQQVKIGLQHATSVTELCGEMASNARIKCKRRAFRRSGPRGKWLCMSETIIAGSDRVVAVSAERAPSVRWALASLSLSMLLSSLGTSSANVGLPTLAHAFNASFQTVQWVVLAYLLAITSLIVSVGRLGDITGRRRLLLAGIFLFTVASVMCGVAPMLGWLIAARAAQGIGAAVMMALTMAFVGETVPKAKTGSALGLLGTMSAIGTALGPSLGGILIAGLGWRAIFLVNVPLGLVAFFLAHRYLPVDRQTPKMDRAGFDKLGTLLLALTLAAYALAMTMGRGRFGSLNVILLLAVVGGVGLFVIVEARAASPLIRLAMFRDPMLSASLAMSALVATVIMATLVVGPFYLSRALGLDAALVGLLLSVGPLVAALTGVPAGRIADRFGAQHMTTVGLIAMATGAFILCLLPVAFGIFGYITPIAIMTAGYGLFQTANNTAVMTDIRPDQRGVISGMLNLSRNLGLITGASVMGAVFTFASATSDITTARPEAVATGMRITFAVAGCLIIAALAIATGPRWFISSETPARRPSP